MGKRIKSSPCVSVFLQVRMSQYIICPLGKGDKTAKASGCLFTCWLCIKPKFSDKKGKKSVTGTIPSQYVQF